MWLSRSCSSKFETRMLVQGQLVEPLIRFSDLFDVFLYDKVRDMNQERQNQVNSFDILTKNPNLKKLENCVCKTQVMPPCPKPVLTPCPILTHDPQHIQSILETV